MMVAQRHFDLGRKSPFKRLDQARHRQSLIDMSGIENAHGGHDQAPQKRSGKNYRIIDTGGRGGSADWEGKRRS